MGAKKAQPEDPFWFEKTQQVRILIKRRGLTQSDLWEKLISLSPDRAPSYKISFDHFKRVIQGNRRRPTHYLDLLKGICEILTETHQSWEQQQKRFEYQSQLLQSEIDPGPAAVSIGKIPKESERSSLARAVNISDEKMPEALANGQDEYLSRVFQFYREDRELLGPIARAYYLSVALPQYPVVTKAEWLPVRPIPLNEFDRELQKHWIPDQPEPPHPQLPVLRGENYAKFVRRMAPKVRQDDDFCYRLLEVRTEKDKLTCVFSPSRYSQFISSCAVLGYEVAEWYMKNQQKRGRRRPRTNGVDLPARGQPRAIFNFENRSACPATSTILILVNTGKENCFYLHRRVSPELFDSPGGLHVVPSGQFQPDGTEDVYHDRDFSLTRTVMRELAEELLGVAEVEKSIWNDKDFYEDPRVQPFVAGLENGAVRAYFLGLGIDPLPTKPDFFAALVVDGSRIPEASLNFIGNWESGGKVLRVPLDRLKLLGHDKRMIPDGAMCLQLADQHLDFLIKQ